MANEHENHGHSVAAWTGVGILIVASAVLAAGVAWGIRWMQVLSIVLMVIGVAATVILGKAGFGAEKITAPALPED